MGLWFSVSENGDKISRKFCRGYNEKDFVWDWLEKR